MTSQKTSGFKPAPKPLSPDEQKRRFAEILNGANPEEDSAIETKETAIETKPMTVRVTVEQYKKLVRLRHKTGMSMNAVCLDLIWTGLKAKIAEFGDI
jgi:hypothetical protein